MPIRTQIRLPQISGSLADNNADAFSFKTGNSASDVVFLQFDTTNSAEMVKFPSADIMAGTGTIRDAGGQARIEIANGANTKISDDSGQLRIDIPDAGSMLLKNQAGNATVVEVADAGIVVTGTVTSDGLILGDDETLALGAASDITIDYDESATDALLIKAGVDGADFKMVMAADRYDDAGDAWQQQIVGGGSGKLSLSNDIASKGTFVEHFSITPNSTILSSVAKFAGAVQIDGDLTVQGARTYLESTEVVIEDKALALGVPSSAVKPNVVGASVSDANPGVITSTAHGLLDNEYVYLYGHSGSTIVDGVYKVQNKTNDTFQIRAAGAGANLDTSSESGATTINHSGLKVTDAGAAGGGIQLPHQDGLASIGWDHTHGWQFSEDVDLASGKHISFGGRSAIDMDSNKIRFDLDAAGAYLSFPSADGSANEFLTTNGSGQLSFSGASTLVPVRIPNKTAFHMATKLTKNNPLSGDGNYSALNVSTRVLSDANLPHQIDVFVNGQLLQSGSGPYGTDVGDDAYVSGDYLGNMNRNALDLKFSFDLEAGDVVQIMEKPEGRA